MLFVSVIAWLAVVFGINTTSDIWKFYTLGEWNLGQLWNITSGIYAKYHVQIMLLFVYTTTRKRFVHIKVFQIKLKYHFSKPIKLQKFLM